GQAVALHTEGDHLQFIGCRLLGNQDTVYTGVGGTRILFKDCYIEGTTDFIFGPSTAWFEHCHIHSKANSYVTAASTPQEVAYGYVFNHCRLTAAQGINKVYLGRPWRPYAHTLFMNCELGSHIVSAGWHNWKNPDNERTARYEEYNNTGEGASTKERVAWSRQLTKKQAAAVTIEQVFRQDNTWHVGL
ncbi:MAG: pectin esterase, partial [Prevotella sp.]|nr:pectin esterase [Prevotella sp.]